MKKSLISAILLLVIIATLGIFIYDAKKQRVNFFLVDSSIEKIELLNKDFDIYLKNTLTYDNFDIIQKKITTFKNELDNINRNQVLKNIQNDKLAKSLKNLNYITENKFNNINKVKSYRAILNNSFRIIQKIKKHIATDDLNNLYTTILTIDKNPELDIKKELSHIDSLIINHTSKYEKYFLKHSKIILQYQLNFITIEDSLKQLNIDEKLNEFNDLYEKYSQDTINKAQLAIGILFFLLVIAILLYLIFEYRLNLSNKELSRFRNTVEKSDNIVVITDENEVIKYVNEAFTNTTGYTPKEAIGKKPSILKSGKQSKEFYKDLQATIHSGKKWSGEFINIDKNGEYSYEKASIMPVLDEKGEIKEFISIKLDITNETITAQQLKEKEKLLVQQSKMAAMGEMLENIAHQWRQPLSLISTAATGLKVQKELGVPIGIEDDIKLLTKINDSAQHLSETINDFRNFFKIDKDKTLFNIKNAYLKTLQLVNSKFKSLSIEVIENLEDIELNSLDGELVQVIMNILNNARDVLETKQNQKRIIFVDIYKDEKENYAIIEIKDNAGGIPDGIIEKVFEPYFTTKHKSQGTGIGLYMSQEMVTKHLNGTLDVKNITYKYESISYTGALFTIKIPLI
ncbi:MAG: PAS domain S-box protein [Campylobacterota bacterium]|nr:PAS domain S-box protein [Campylobacterota bacterium]